MLQACICRLQCCSIITKFTCSHKRTLSICCLALNDANVFADSSYCDWVGVACCQTAGDFFSQYCTQGSQSVAQIFITGKASIHNCCLFSCLQFIQSLTAGCPCSFDACHAWSSTGDLQQAYCLHATSARPAKHFAFALVRPNVHAPLPRMIAANWSTQLLWNVRPASLSCVYLACRW